MTQKSAIFRWFLAVAVIAALAFLGIRYPKPGEIPDFPSPIDVEVLGVTHFSGMEVSGSETDALVVNQTSTGDIAEFRDNGTAVLRIADGGATYLTSNIKASMPVSLTTASDTLVATDVGTLIYNAGAGNGVTVTLPSAAAGLNFCFYNYVAKTLYVDVPSGDQIQHLTNSTGDAIVNTTAGDHICLVAVDTTNWVITDEEGTWSDAE